MRSHSTYALRAVRVRPLVACLAVLVSADALAGSGAGNHSHFPAPQRAITQQGSPDHPAQTWSVLNCSDNAADSLREIITNPNKAHSGDTVDLSQLPMLCGMADSTITLTSGEIAIVQSNLTLQGPAEGEGTVTLSGGGSSRVLRHADVGTLSIHDLTIADGYYHAASTAYGGCIEAIGGSVYLSNAKVIGCTVLSDTVAARGGGIHNVGSVTLVASSILGNQALAPTQSGYGGGVHANELIAKYASISANVAGDGANGGRGGGAFATAGVSVIASTIDNNAASYGGGLTFNGGGTIANSTISDNVAHVVIAAAYSTSGDSLTISNSTIAFNRAETSSPYGAVHFQGLSGASSLILQSSIIADNTTGTMGMPSDLSLFQGVLSGADNLVMVSSISPPGVITVTTDPKLGPLQFNGGSTRTRALLSGSPALGAGNQNGLPPGIVNDQRGAGYPRTMETGPIATTDIGAFEFDTIFSGHFDSN